MTPGLSIPWDALEPMLSGTSGIDVPHLYVRTLDAAETFLESYGYEWAHPHDRQEMDALRQEAIVFIERDLLVDEPDLTIPPDIRAETDIRKLLLWASDPARIERQRWTCSLLRVMHTFAHCGSYFDEKYSTPIREQIQERFRPHLFENERGLRLGAGPAAIPLVAFEMREKKTRTSLALKLLHKRENIGSDIFDWVGVRFVTEDRYDALRVVRYLRENNAVNFMQVRPGRSRNTLLDVERIQRDVQELNEDLRAGRIPDYQLESLLRDRVNSYTYPSPPERSYNPLSSIAYHSIQFTCLQRIRVRDRDAALMRNMLERVPRRESVVLRALTQYLERMEPGADIRFLFPFEVQILDRHSYDLSRSGLASHAVYKERQRQRVKERLFGAIAALRRG